MIKANPNPEKLAGDNVNVLSIQAPWLTPYKSSLKLSALKSIAIWEYQTKGSPGDYISSINKELLDLFRHGQKEAIRH